MWSYLTKSLSIVSITVILFTSVMIGMTMLSENGGGAWGLDDSISPEAAANESFEKGDYRFLSIRFTHTGKPGRRLDLGASCWPQSFNEIHYEVDNENYREPERGAHTKRAEYAREYNRQMVLLLKGSGMTCKSLRAK